MRHPSPRIRKGAHGTTNGRNLMDDAKDAKFNIAELMIQIQKMKA